ncbi:MAG: GDP-L-fucose synthase [Spirochaetales bacterium]|nr:GDP-L-fucose synthase [Spirochaetales bacterium]
MNKSDKIYVAGHRGLVGRAILKSLQRKGYKNIITRTHNELDLTRQIDVETFFEEQQPDYVFLAAAKVGGIGGNSTYPADFIYINMAIALNVIHSAYKVGVKKLLNLGSTCIYPKMAPQPLKEDALLTGPLEVTNEAYALAKISAIRLCKHYNDQYGTNYISAMPTNLYGPGDSYDLETAHVLPTMIRKFHEAKTNGGKVLLWGDGSPLREFLYSEDLADAVIYLMENKDYSDIGEFINVGSGKELSIKKLAETIARIVGFEGEVEWDSSKPNGTPRKLSDISRLVGLGWKPKVELETGIAISYDDFQKRFCL